ncbi:hypothetical protein [Aminobacter sp. SS-2016]|uniref:hypothetical protein n=1 Tax=Aminobacter sp. Y103A TaxID=1870862 RepID=UPI0025748B99|nr:hypothetical protein [Aminobacter sp. SS-2016]
MSKALLALPLALMSLSAAPATEKDFLQTLSGSWQGSGQVRLRPDTAPVPVVCTLRSRSKGASLNLDGNCRAKIVFSRRIGVDLRAEGARYSGTYVGSRRGAASLAGRRSGDTVTLQINWPDRGSGARVATMQVASRIAGKMRIVTVERHPQTGNRVVTADIAFSRNQTGLFYRRTFLSRAASFAAWGNPS